MATIVMPSSEIRSSTPVSTGRVSSREAARTTRSAVASRRSAGRTRPVPSSGGSSGKSAACRQFRVKLDCPPVRLTAPSPPRCSSETGPSTIVRTTSAASRGSTTAPGSSTVAARGMRRESSMSVAASCGSPASALSRTWDRIWIVLFEDAARLASASFPASSSLGHVSRTPRP